MCLMVVLVFAIGACDQTSSAISDAFASLENTIKSEYEYGQTNIPKTITKRGITFTITWVSDSLFFSITDIVDGNNILVNVLEVEELTSFVLRAYINNQSREFSSSILPRPLTNVERALLALSNEVNDFYTFGDTATLPTRVNIDGFIFLVSWVSSSPLLFHIADTPVNNRLEVTIGETLEDTSIFIMATISGESRQFDIVITRSPIFTGSPLLFSKYFSAMYIIDNALEIYNISDYEVNLTGWTISIYPWDSLTAQFIIPLSGTIAPNDFFVIANAGAENPQLLAVVDQFSSDLRFNGRQAIVLRYQGDDMDILGQFGNPVFYGQFVALFRKADKFFGKSEFNAYNFIMYLEGEHGSFDYIKTFNHTIQTSEQLNFGPRITDEIRELPFVIFENNQWLGGGGLLEVTLDRTVDGDTAFFTAKNPGEGFPDIVTNEQFGRKTVSVRYVFIDTPEFSVTGGYEPWGKPASNLMAEILYNARDNNLPIYIQTVYRGGIDGAFGRFLGLVWVDGELANFIMIRAGLSTLRPGEMAGSGSMRNFHYMGVTWYGFFNNANLRAIQNGWGIFGELDPTWDYTNNRPGGNQTWVPPARA